MNEKVRQQLQDATSVDAVGAEGRGLRNALEELDNIVVADVLDLGLADLAADPVIERRLVQPHF